MKKTWKLIALVACLTTLLGACSSKDMSNEESQMNNSTKQGIEDTKKMAEDVADKTKNTVDDSIDNVMDYFNKQGVMYENTQAIDNMDFAAYEGRSFTNNGQTAYLYRVKSEDENMKKVLQEAKDKGKVKVKINDKEEEYGAKVNGEYLLLYNAKADMGEMLTTFPHYQATGMDETSNTTNEAENKGVNSSDKSNTAQ